MSNVEEEEKLNGGAGNDKTKLEAGDGENTTTVDLEPDSKAKLINANGGAGGGGDHDDDLSTDVKSGVSEVVPFNGLGKDEVMKYADEPFWVRLRWILFILFWVGWVAMLVTAIVIIVLAPRCPPRPDMKWYQTETVYQVLSKSFKDSDGDGVGDFKGLKDSSKDYIMKDLGANAIWLDSIYKVEDALDSERAILDHKDLDEKFGATISEFKNWLKSMRKDMKQVILDLIPNQTGKTHNWFVKSEAGDAPYADYYVWKDGADTTPPNELKNRWGDSAWTYSLKRGAWYFSQNGEDYPDLNLRNEAVREEIKDIMKFWLNAGISGFHIKDLEYLVEGEELKNADAKEESITLNNRATLPFLEELRDVIDDFSDKPGRERLLFGTVTKANENQTLEYWGSEDKKRLHIVNPVLSELEMNCKATCLKNLIEKNLFDERRQWLGYSLGNQDVDRVATRMGDEKGLKVAHSVQMLLQGTAFNYYGDEFGQENAGVPISPLRDDHGRDGFRTPMQWNSGENAGFSTANSSSLWLPVGADYHTVNMETARAHFKEDSALSSFKKLVELRQKESFQWGKTVVCAPNEDLFIFTRRAERFPYFLVVINMGSTGKTIDVKNLMCGQDLEFLSTKDEATVQYHSRNERVGEILDLNNHAFLEPKDVFVLEFAV